MLVDAFVFPIGLFALGITVLAVGFSFWQKRCQRSLHFRGQGILLSVGALLCVALVIFAPGNSAIVHRQDVIKLGQDMQTVHQFLQKNANNGFPENAKQLNQRLNENFDIQVIGPEQLKPSAPQTMKENRWRVVYMPEITQNKTIGYLLKGSAEYGRYLKTGEVDYVLGSSLD